MDDDIFVAEALVALADRAPGGPIGLAASVERRFVRRRRVRAMSAAGAVAVAVGIAFAVPAALRPPAHHPAPTPWRFAPAAAALPPVGDVWPDAALTIPAETPTHEPTDILRRLDDTHVLIAGSTTVGGEPASHIYSFDTGTQTFTLLTTFPDTYVYDLPFGVSAHWIFWRSQLSDHLSIYKAPLTGGPATLVTTLDAAQDYMGPWYATDDALYWSDANRAVLRLPTSGAPGAQPEPVPGFEGMAILYGTSPWAMAVSNAQQPNGPDTGVTRAMKNLLTGQRIDVVIQPGTYSLECVPTFCVGNTDPQDPRNPPDGAPYIERPDGTGLAALPWSPPIHAVPVGDGGGLLLSPVVDENENWLGVSLTDPLTGRGARSDTAGLRLVPFGDLIGRPDGTGLHGTVIDLTSVH